MEGWQAVDRTGVFTGNSQFLIAIVQQSTAQYPCIHLEIETPKAPFDNDFPKAGRTEKQFVKWVLSSSNWSVASGKRSGETTAHNNRCVFVIADSVSSPLEPSVRFPVSMLPFINLAPMSLVEFSHSMPDPVETDF